MLISCVKWLPLAAIDYLPICQRGKQPFLLKLGRIDSSIILRWKNFFRHFSKCAERTKAFSNKIRKLWSCTIQLLTVANQLFMSKPKSQNSEDKKLCSIKNILKLIFKKLQTLLLGCKFKFESCNFKEKFSSTRLNGLW